MIKLAWRNIWRNKRRTLITAASVFFAVFLAILMRGFHMGAWLNLIDNVLHSYSGYVQIHAKDYWENKTFDYTFQYNDSVFANVKENKQVEKLIPRLESFSLASSGNKTKGVIVIGIDPDAEKNFSRYNKFIVQGSYLANNDKEVMLGERLAKFLGLNVNDSIVLLSQGYQGASANGIYKIKAIVRIPSPEFDNQLVLMTLPQAQELYSAQGLLTSLVVDIKDPQKMDQVVKQIKHSIDLQKYEVLTWEEMLVELYQQYRSDEGSGLIMLTLLYIIVGFGVFGTVLMMFSERKRELGLMIVVGMQRSTLLKMLSFELIYVCVMGILFGLLASLPFIAYFHFNPIAISGDLAKVYEAFGMEPILPVAWQTDYIFQQAINVSVIVLIVLMYPLYSVYKMNLNNALRR